MVNSNYLEKCKYCNGKGWVFKTHLRHSFYALCFQCDGHGIVDWLRNIIPKATTRAFLAYFNSEEEVKECVEKIKKENNEWQQLD